MAEGWALSPAGGLPQAAVERVTRLRGLAIDTGLMAGGADVKHHFAPDGKALSAAIGRGGQVPADDERTP